MHVRQVAILNVLIISSASQIPPVMIKDHIIADQVGQMLLQVALSRARGSFFGFRWSFTPIDFICLPSVLSKRCYSGFSSDCPIGQSCFPSTPCEENSSFFCGSTFDEATGSCTIPCPLGQSMQCPDGQGCFPYTLCERDGTNAAPTPALAPIPSAPLDSYYCGNSFDDASSLCDLPCPSGLSADCPGDLLCFAGTSCEASASFFCGKTWDQAASTCTMPCENGLCPNGEQCFGFTPCMMDNTFYCGMNFDEASRTCSIPCPSGSDSDCPGLATCHKYTTCGNGVPSLPAEPTYTPGDSFFCGFSFDDASASCVTPCESGSSTECPVGQACFAHTTCSMNYPETFFCGKTLFESNLSCTDPCPTGKARECPDGTSCFAYTTCAGDEFIPPTFNPDEPDGPGTTPGGSGTAPGGSETTPGGSTVPGVSVNPSDPNEIPMVEVPTESYFCGVSFDDASSQCAQPCKNGLCPNGEQCFAQTPCLGTQPGTYFCGRNIADARNCAIPCYSGSSAQCPTGQSCYAYTTCNAEAQTTPGGSSVPGVSVDPFDPTKIPMVEVPTESYFCGVSFDDASSQCVQPCVNGLCPNGEECFAQTPCLGTQPGTYFCGRNIDDARNCAIPCPSGSSAQCPTGKSCYAYTTCNASNPAPSPPTESPTKKAMIPNVSEVVPAESFFCGGSYEDASDRCALPCSGGDSSDCPGIEQCYAYTPCNNPGSFFCGNSLENANEACAIPCPTGKSNTCPSGESCYAYTICNPITGSPTNKQTPNPTLPPPIIRDDIFPASASDFTFLDVLLNDEVAEGAVGPLKVMDVLPSPLPVDQNARQLQGGTNLGQLRGGDEEASTESTVASWDQPMEFSLGNAQVLPGGLPSTMGGLCEITGSRNRMRYTPPSMVSPLSNDPLPSTPFSDACLYQACDNNGNGGCGSGLITLDVFSEPTSKPTNLPTPLPTKWPTRNPTPNVRHDWPADLFLNNLQPHLSLMFSLFYITAI